MMKLALTLVFLSLLALSATAATLQPFSIVVMCSEDDPKENLELDYDEIGVIQGHAIVLGQGNAPIEGNLVLYANPETKTYTVIFEALQLHCIVASGTELGPVVYGDEI